MEDWALIRRLAAEGVPKKQIAERLGISRTTVVKAVGSSAPPKYERTPAPTSLSPFEARVRALLDEHPEMPATVLAERVEWSGSITWFRDNVRRLRPEHRRPDPADRLSWAVGGADSQQEWASSAGRWRPACINSSRTIPSPKVWSSVATGSSRHRSCRRSFESPADFNAQFTERDNYVRVDSSDYSVDPNAIGRLVVVTADLERVRVRLDGRIVADHPRVWARQMTVTDPAHVEIAQLLREQFGRPSVVADDLLARDLADYDRAFGLDTTDGQVA